MMINIKVYSITVDHSVYRWTSADSKTVYMIPADLLIKLCEQRDLHYIIICNKL